VLELCTLASGSSGNSLLVTDGRTHVLVDAGISCRRICTGLKELGVEPTELAGVLITHEHSDHISGLTTLTKQLRLPVYASPGTGRQLCYRIAFLEELLRPVAPGEGFSIGGLAIESFPTSHDAAGSVGYILSGEGGRIVLATDLGYITPAVKTAVQDCGLLICEANHDEDWVRSGPYPYALKQRILGDFGHLSNEAGGGGGGRAGPAGLLRILRILALIHDSLSPCRASRQCAALRPRIFLFHASCGAVVTDP